MAGVVVVLAVGWVRLRMAPGMCCSCPAGGPVPRGVRNALLLVRGAGCCPAIVRAMYDDDDYVSSALYLLMPPRRRSDIREALDAARGDGSGVREALDAARGTAPEPADDGGVFWPATRQRQWPRRLSRILSRMDTWTLIVAVAGVMVAAAGVYIAYLTLVKTG